MYAGAGAASKEPDFCQEESHHHPKETPAVACAELSSKHGWVVTLRSVSHSTGELHSLVAAAEKGALQRWCAVVSWDCAQQLDSETMKLPHTEQPGLVINDQQHLEHDEITQPGYKNID